MKPCINLLECIDSGVRAVKIAVAYVKKSGVNRFSEFLQNTKECLIIASLDFGITELEGLKELRKLGCNVYLYNGGNEFHPKVYVLDYGHKKIAVIGSSNLSEGAITGKNIEFNLIVEEDEIVREAEVFINKLLTESNPVTDDLISQLEKNGYEKIRRAVYDKPGEVILSLLRKRDKYCEGFIKLYEEIQKYKVSGNLIGIRDKIHEMTINKIVCDLTSYGIDVKVSEKKVAHGPDIIIDTEKSKVRIKVQGMVLPNKTAIIHNLDFDYFIIVLIIDFNSVEYFILDKNEIEGLVKKGGIRFNRKLNSYNILSETYKMYKSNLDDFIKKLLL
ncbi:phospholipase D family protein [Acidianus sp. HS-5]|uniref:phospholipase D-like domain-containing protein n=1 Tax=Acidianus sp. HS-5 TaxID=2886040 RepID=UPI001F2B3BFA|nr:phospholipase D family protein [Acidianus sp. HS-5]